MIDIFRLDSAVVFDYIAGAVQFFTVVLDKSDSNWGKNVCYTTVNVHLHTNTE